MNKYHVGDRLSLRTGNGGELEATVTKVEDNGYYQLVSIHHPFPMALSERVLDQIIVPCRQKVAG